MDDELEQRLRAIDLTGLVARCDEIKNESWVERVIVIATEERRRRGLDSRLESSELGRFKPLADYDWSWPRAIDRQAIDELVTLGFQAQGAKVLLVGPSGVGKTMIAKNLAHAVIRAGRTARFTTASAMLKELAAQAGLMALSRAYRRYTSPAILVSDEFGYIAYGNRESAAARGERREELRGPSRRAALPRIPAGSRPTG